MNHKTVVLLFFVFGILNINAQNLESSLTPEELPETFFGSWVNDKQESILIITSDYLIFNNKLWYYNAIYCKKRS